MSKINIRKRGNYYEYRVEIAPIDGKRQWLSKSGYRTKPEAQEAGVQAYNEYLNAGIPFKLCDLSYSDYLDYWLDNYCKNNLRYNTILVSVCAVDSEIGFVQPIEEIGKLLKQYNNIVFHTDASQAIGKVNMYYSNCDLITIAPHKFYGMNGISILIKKKNISLQPLILGGRSTTIYRSGTPVTGLITSTEVALNKALMLIEEKNRYIQQLNKILIIKFKEYKNININSETNSVPHTINISIKGIKSDLFVSKLNDKGIMVSTKTSCCPLNAPSKLVYALTKDKGLASTSIRISLSHLTKKEEIEMFLSIFDSIYKELT